MPTAALNGTTIHYEDTGGKGPAVILSHGFLMDHTMFDAQVAALRATSPTGTPRTTCSP